MTQLVLLVGLKGQLRLLPGHTKSDRRYEGRIARYEQRDFSPHSRTMTYHVVPSLVWPLENSIGDRDRGLSVREPMVTLVRGVECISGLGFSKRLKRARHLSL